MKVISKIAKSELSFLFYSPVAWLILVVFTFQTSMTFADLFAYYVEDQEVRGYLLDTTERIYTARGSILYNVQQYLYLYIPLLTMGLMSKEKSSGTIKLLFSSPITNTQIVLGKYFAMMIYTLLLMAILMVYIIFGCFTVEAMDLPYALSGLLGLYLLTCAYSAIGLFMSCLTTYQVAAAMGTLALLSVLNFIGQVGQDIPFVRDITYWLSIRGRSNEMLSGLICSEDVLYFVIVVVLFLLLSIYKLTGDRKKVSRKVSMARYGGIVCVAMALGYLSSMPVFMRFYDATAMKKRTLTVNSQNVMNKLNGELTITTYVNLLEGNFEQALPKNLNREKLMFRQYIRFKPEMKMKYVYYYDKAKNESLDKRFPNLNDKERARKLAEGLELDFDLFLSPDEIRKQIDLSGERNRFVRLIERENGQKTFLRVFDDMQKQPSESEISAALKRLVVAPVRVAFLSGHGERDIKRKGDRDYFVFSRDITFRYALVNNGFDVFELDLQRQKTIPEDVQILVIADLKKALSSEELEEIQRYLNKGGNMIIAGEPGRQDYMNPIIASLGIQFMPGRVLQRSEDFDPNLVLGRITEEGKKLSGDFRWMARWNYRVPMPNAVGITYTPTEGMEIIPFIGSDTTGCWNELETMTFSGDGATMNPEIGEKEGARVLALQAKRQVNQKEQRILVLGDADWFSNGELFMRRKNVNTENKRPLLYCFSWLTDGEFPINTDRPSSPDRFIHMGLAGVLWLKIGFMAFFPLVLVVYGIIIQVKRKRK